MIYNSKIICTFVILFHKPRFQTETWMRAIDNTQQSQLLAFVYNCWYKLAYIHFYDYFVPCSKAQRFNTRTASLKEQIHLNIEFDLMPTIIQSCRRCSQFL